MSHSTKIAALTLGLVLVAIAVAQTSQPTRIRGEIVSFNGETLVVHRGSGDTVSISLAASVPVAALRRMQLADIKAGSFIGTATKTDTQGKLTAQEVVVFPESERGTGEGHYAWDLGSHSMMTNANVDAVVERTSGNVLHLSYKGGKNTVTVPPNVPVVTFIPATHRDLVAGKKVFVVATEDSAKRFVAQRVIVEKDGVVPPM